MYKKIMVGYDNTKFSDCALKEAIRLAKGTGAKLLLVTAPEVDVEVQTLAPEANALVEKNASVYMKRAEAKMKKAGIDFETMIVITISAPETLVELAKKNKVDLIVLGTHGRTGLRRLLMGSTTARVIGNALCNVLVVRCP